MKHALRLALAGLAAAPLRADPDARDAMPEPLPPSGFVSGTLLPLAGKHIHFAVVGDYGWKFGQPAPVAAMIRSWEPDFIVTTGDNTYGPVNYFDTQPAVPGVQTGWDDHVGRYYGDYILRREDGRYESLRGTVQRFFPSAGNHDHAWLDGAYTGVPEPPPEEGYRDFFHLNPGGTPRLPADRGAVHTDFVSYYALRRGPVDLFILDSNQPFLTDGIGALMVADQNAWLEAEARASTAPWKLAVYHHPPPRPWQVAWQWIPPERLSLCHAVLAGHAHVYERYLWQGLPVLVSGNGGASLHTRAQPFYPDTLAVDDRHYGALRVRAGAEYLVFESRSLELTTGTELLADRFLLGNPAAVPDLEDEYVFYADAGESIHCAAAAPFPLQLVLCAPDGYTAARSTDTTLSAPITVSGRWKLRAAPLTETGGSYELNVRLRRPGPGYEKWSAALPPEHRSPHADADGDGVPNLLAWALSPAGGTFTGAAFEVGAVPGAALVRVELPSLLRPGCTLTLESAATPSAPAWAVLAERKPFAAWTSPADASLTLLPAANGCQLLQVIITLNAQRHFFRLRATLNP